MQPYPSRETPHLANTALLPLHKIAGRGRLAPNGPADQYGLGMQRVAARVVRDVFSHGMWK